MTWMYLGISFILIALDQYTKFLALKYLNPFNPISIIDSFFNLTLVKNRGAAFGFLSGMDDPLRSIIFTIISLTAFIIIAYIYCSRPQGSRMVPLAVAMILGGAAGNTIDRIRLGHVIDFLDFYYRNLHWPTFNLADSSITIGVSLLLLQMLMAGRKDDAS